MEIDNNIEKRALSLNGIYESVLAEIIESQIENQGKVFYLQPYTDQIIRELSKFPPKNSYKWDLYISITTDLNNIHYIAEICGWENKDELNDIRITELNAHLRIFQKNEGEIFPEGNDKIGINLISIKNLRKLDIPIPSYNLFKTKDGIALKSRTRAGKWSYVYPLMSDKPNKFILKSHYDNHFQERIVKSEKDDDELRRKRLEKAIKIPTKTQVVSYVYDRNPDVVAEVLKRANGLCELCKKEAPFLKASNSSRYLEVHHWLPLADGGEDTVQNATALCPNCHKESHFGQNKNFIKTKRMLPLIDN